MKKRNNPKIDAMRDRSLMLESERQNSHTTKYSLTEQEEIVTDYDRAWDYKKDGEDYYTKKKTSDNWIKTKPGSKPYETIKSKVFKDDTTTDDSKTGCIDGDCENGQGTYIPVFYDGISGKYVGSFKNSKKEGQGEYTVNYEDGDWYQYVGEWKDGRIDGQGTEIWKSGSKYVGEWKEGEEHGQGTKTYPDGRKEEGEWSDGDFIGEESIPDVTVNESKVDYIGHNANMGQIIFTIKGWRVNGDVITIFLNPKVGHNVLGSKLNLVIDMPWFETTMFKLNFNMKNNTTEWDYSDVRKKDPSPDEGTEQLMGDIEESMVEFNIDSIDLGSSNIDVPLRHLILTTKSKTGKISEEEKKILTKLDGYISQTIKK